MTPIRPPFGRRPELVGNCASSYPIHDRTRTAPYTTISWTVSLVPDLKRRRRSSWITTTVATAASTIR